MKFPKKVMLGPIVKNGREAVNIRAIFINLHFGRE